MKTITIILFLFVTFIQSYSESWSPLGAGTGWGTSLAVYNGELYAGGVYGILKWNGTSWSSLGSGVSGEVDAMIVYNNKLVVGGRFLTAGGINVLYIAQWDGSVWSDIGGGPDNYVQSMAVYGNELILGGYFATCEGIPANSIVGYNGTTGWYSLGNGMGGSQGTVMAMTVYNNELIAVGFFTTASGISANHIAKWNGTLWSALGSGINWVVYAVNTYNGNLIAGGLFATAGGIAANDIAKWNGTSWSALGSGCSGGFYPYVMGLVFYGNDLYVGGLYTVAGGMTVNGIAKWNDNSGWSSLGSGFWSGGSNVFGAYAIGIYNNELIATGIFSSVNNVSAGNIAKYSGLVGIKTSGEGLPANFKLYPNYPNPFNPSTKIKFDIQKSSFTNITVFDILGKEVSTLVNEQLKSGSYEVNFDGTNLPSGVYFYRIESGTFTENKKMILLK